MIQFDEKIWIATSKVTAVESGQVVTDKGEPERYFVTVNTVGGYEHRAEVDKATADYLVTEFVKACS